MIVGLHPVQQRRLVVRFGIVEARSRDVPPPFPGVAALHRIGVWACEGSLGYVANTQPQEASNKSEIPQG